MTAIGLLHQPEYTGDNRCIPCTAANIAIAIVVSVLVIPISIFLAGSVFALSLAAIYFRGYLVPGTPTLTKRYLPAHVLQWFERDSTALATDESFGIDPEQVLLGADTIEFCQQGTEFCLTSEFHAAWRERIRAARTHDLDEEVLTNALTVPRRDDQITVDQYNDAFVARTHDSVIAQWSSQAAVVADVAAAAELDKRHPNWARFSPPEVARVLMSLRIFLEQCPECDGPIRVGQEVVESCCRSYDVVAASCQECDARLFEMEWDDTDTEEPPTQPNQSTQPSA